MATAFPGGTDNFTTGKVHGDVGDAVIALETYAVGLSSVVSDPVRSYSKIKCYTYDPMMNGNVSGGAMTSGTVYICKMPLFTTATLTGMIIPCVVTGSYTAATNNRIGLYRSDGTDLTLVASSADDGNLWKGTAGASADRAFSTPYTPSAITEHIYGAYLYRNSAQTTAPTLARMQTVAPLVDIGATGGQHRSGNLSVQTDLPATIPIVNPSWSGGSGQSLYWMGAY